MLGSNSYLYIDQYIDTDCMQWINIQRSLQIVVWHRHVRHPTQVLHNCSQFFSENRICGGKFIAVAVFNALGMERAENMIATCNNSRVQKESDFSPSRFRHGGWLMAPESSRLCRVLVVWTIGSYLTSVTFTSRVQPALSFASCINIVMHNL